MISFHHSIYYLRLNFRNDDYLDVNLKNRFFLIEFENVVILLYNRDASVDQYFQNPHIRLQQIMFFVADSDAEEKVILSIKK